MKKKTEPTKPAFHKWQSEEPKFIFAFLRGLFVETDPTTSQFSMVLAWLKHAMPAQPAQPAQPGRDPGLVLILIGPAGVGKTLFASVLLPKLLLLKSYYNINATDLLKSEHAAVTKHPLIVVEGATNRTLKHAAEINGWSENVPLWRRWVICDNSLADARETLRDIRYNDKFLCLKCGEHGVQFPQDHAETTEILDREIPAFRAFLEKMEYAPGTLTGGRYLLKPYIHPDFVVNI